MAQQNPDESKESHHSKKESDDSITFDLADHSQSNHASNRRTEIILVRHCETHANQGGIYQGQTDSSLTLKGERDAKNLGLRLASIHLHERKIDAIYSSDLGRAKQTLELALNSFQEGEIRAIPIEYSEALRERHMGILQGMTKSEAKSKHADVFKALEADNDYRIEGGGESANDVQKRASEFLEEIYLKHKKKRVLIVSHGGTISALLNYVYAKRPPHMRWRPTNGGINVIEKEMVQDESKEGFEEKDWLITRCGDDGFGIGKGDDGKSHVCQSCCGSSQSIVMDRRTSWMAKNTQIRGFEPSLPAIDGEGKRMDRDRATTSGFMGKTPGRLSNHSSLVDRSGRSPDTSQTGGHSTAIVCGLIGVAIGVAGLTIWQRYKDSQNFFGLFGASKRE